MKLKVIKIDGASAGSVELGDDIFGLDPRVDILHRVVRWQRNKAQAGTHKVKTRSETSYSRKKIYRQKGTGGARHGDRNAPIFRKGGVYKGPKPRSHSFSLTKKFRNLGLRHALSSKFSKGNLVVLDKAELDNQKTNDFSKKLQKLKWGRTLLIGREDNPKSLNFFNASKNIPKLDVLSVNGINVYDVLRKDTLVLTKSAVNALEERLS